MCHCENRAVRSNQASILDQLYLPRELLLRVRCRPKAAGGAAEWVPLEPEREERMKRHARRRSGCMSVF